MEHNVSPQKPEAPASFSAEHHTHMGPLLGMLIIALAIIFGGLYLWGAMLGKEAGTLTQQRTLPNNEPETTRAVVDQEILKTLSPSNDLDALYADLESTNLDNLDTELDQIGKEMGG